MSLQHCLASKPSMWPGSLLSTSTCRLEVSFEVTLVNAFVGGIQEMEKKLLPVPCLWRSWGQTAIDGATARLKQRRLS